MSALLRAVDVPGCTVLLAEPWDASPGRFFAAWSARGAYRWFLGHGVLDEFGTVSSPVFVCPAPLLGRVYDAGLSLALRRDPELPLDSGWPPVCLGLDAPAPEVGRDWEETLLAAVSARGGEDGGSGVTERAVEGTPFSLARWTSGGVAVLATDAPLLPHHLRRLAAVSPAAFTLALATGNRVGRRESGAPGTVEVVAESTLESLAAAAGAS